MGKSLKNSSKSKGLAALRNSGPYPLFSAEPPSDGAVSGHKPSAAAIARMMEGSRLRSDLEELAEDDGSALLAACDMEMADEFLADALASGEVRLVLGKNGDGDDDILVETKNMQRFKELEAEYIKLTGSLLPSGDDDESGKLEDINIVSSSAGHVGADLIAANSPGCASPVSNSVGAGVHDLINIEGKGPGECSVQGVESQVGGGINGSQSLDVEMVENLGVSASHVVGASGGASCGGGIKAGFGGLTAGFIPPVCAAAGGSSGDSQLKSQGVSKQGAGAGRKSMNAGVGEKLSFVPPSGKKFSVDGSEAFSLKEVWGSVLLGQYVGAPLPNFKIAELMRDWGVPANFRFEGGWIIFQFQSDEDRDKVLREGPYFVYNKPMIVKLVPEFFAFNKKEITTVPLWVRLSGVSKQLWKPKILSGLASYVGVPLFMDPVTSGKKRGAFARVLIEINLAADIPKEVEFDIVVRGSVISAVCQFEIENEPVFCKTCCEFGHFSVNCMKGLKKGPCPSSAYPDQEGSNDGWKSGSKSLSYAQAVNKNGWSNWKGKKKVEVQQGAGAVSFGKKGWVPVSSKEVSAKKAAPVVAGSSEAPSGGSEGVSAAGCSAAEGVFGVLASDPKPCPDDESSVLRARKLRLMEEGLLEDCGGETDSMCSEDYGDFASGGDFVEDLMEDICRPDFVDEEGFQKVVSKSQRKKSKANDGRDIVLGMKAKPKWPGDPCTPSSGGRPGKASRRIP